MTFKLPQLPFTLRGKAGVPGIVHMPLIMCPTTPLDHPATWSPCFLPRSPSSRHIELLLLLIQAKPTLASGPVPLAVPSAGNRASQVAQWVKNPPSMKEMQEMLVQSLGREDPLEEGMATHSSILARMTEATEPACTARNLLPSAVTRACPSKSLRSLLRCPLKCHPPHPIPLCPTLLYFSAEHLSALTLFRNVFVYHLSPPHLTNYSRSCPMCKTDLIIMPAHMGVVKLQEWMQQGASCGAWHVGYTRDERESYCYCCCYNSSKEGVCMQ